MSSTRKTSRNLRWAKGSLGGAVAAVADAAAAVAAGAVVQAAEPAAAAESRGVGPGVVATPVRPQRFTATSTDQVGLIGLVSVNPEAGSRKRRARLRRFGLPVMSVDPIKKCWRENCSTRLLCSDVTGLSQPIGMH